LGTGDTAVDGDGGLNGNLINCFLFKTFYKKGDYTMKKCGIGIVAVFLAFLLTGCQSIEGHEGAVVGGALGAGGGALIGSAAAGSGNRGTGAAIGAAVGGVAGAVAGDQLYDKKKDD
jgi:hypothetical protein